MFTSLFICPHCKKKIILPHQKIAFFIKNVFYELFFLKKFNKNNHIKCKMCRGKIVVRRKHSLFSCFCYANILIGLLEMYKLHDLKNFECLSSYYSSIDAKMRFYQIFTIVNTFIFFFLIPILLPLDKFIKDEEN